MPDNIVRVIFIILCAVSNLNKLKIGVELWDNENLCDPESHITCADPHDFGDIDEQIFRPSLT